MIYYLQLLSFLRQTQCLLKTNRIIALPSLIQCKINIYYINTNEIPGDLLHENLISVFTCENITVAAMTTYKKLLKWNGLLVVHWCLYNRTLHGHLEIQNFSSRVEKIFHSFTGLTHEIFFDTRREISYLHAAM